MKKESKKEEKVVEDVSKIASPTAVEEYNPEDGPPTKLEHFEIYNKWARKNKLPVKAPTEDFYPKIKVRFQRFDQPTNVLKARCRKKHIDWTGQLIPGGVYELCIPVIRWLTSLAEPIYAQVEVKTDTGNGQWITKQETKQVGERARFSCQQMEFNA